jgi:hypothetical protein
MVPYLEVERSEGPAEDPEGAVVEGGKGWCVPISADKDKLGRQEGSRELLGAVGGDVVGRGVGEGRRRGSEGREEGVRRRLGGLQVLARQHQLAAENRLRRRDVLGFPGGGTDPQQDPGQLAYPVGGGAPGSQGVFEPAVEPPDEAV